MRNPQAYQALVGLEQLKGIKREEEIISLGFAVRQKFLRPDFISDPDLDERLKSAVARAHIQSAELSLNELTNLDHAENEESISRRVFSITHQYRLGNFVVDKLFSNRVEAAEKAAYIKCAELRLEELAASNQILEEDEIKSIMKSIQRQFLLAGINSDSKLSEISAVGSRANIQSAERRLMELENLEKPMQARFIEIIQSRIRSQLLKGGQKISPGDDLDTRIKMAVIKAHNDSAEFKLQELEQSKKIFEIIEIADIQSSIFEHYKLSNKVVDDATEQRLKAAAARAHGNSAEQRLVALETAIQSTPKLSLGNSISLILEQYRFANVQVDENLQQRIRAVQMKSVGQVDQVNQVNQVSVALGEWGVAREELTMARVKALSSVVLSVSACALSCEGLPTLATVFGAATCILSASAWFHQRTFRQQMNLKPQLKPS